jgi:glycosyltransferase involved in cell wall biosynthesis
MRAVIADVQVPFISGGGEALAMGLLRALRRAGHEVELITMTFRFSPDSEVLRSIISWEAEDFDELNGYSPDIAICLRFPTYCLQHHRKVVWLLHQHRAFYDLWNGEPPEDAPERYKLRQWVIQKDTAHLASVKHVYTISQNVSKRLKHFNGLRSTPLYHPPPMFGKLYTAEPEAYIFAPSRLESLKRQWLLIEAMQYVRAPIAALIAGAGGQERQYAKLIDQLGLGARIRLVGRLSEEDLAAYYACCLGVFFGPSDEDYGYITLEAMLARKPVITCTDSGGPLEFVVNQETGLVVEPNPHAVAAAIESLYGNRKRAAELGAVGYARYQGLQLSWDNVANELVRQHLAESAV